MRFTNQELEAGALRFTTEDRTVGGVGGPAIRVFGPSADGRANRQLLRFDCFNVDPHYHYDPDGRDEVTHLTDMDHYSAFDWTMEQLRTQLPDLVRRGGGSDAAVEASRAPAAAAAVAQIETAFREWRKGAPD